MPTNRHPQANDADLGRINNYSDDVEFAAQVDGNSVYTVTMKNLAAHGGSAAAAGVVANDGISPGPFGNNVVTDKDCVIHGYDYLGQPMTESIDFSASAAGKKAFRKIVTVTDGATLTWGDEYGLPYAMASESDGDAVGTAAVTTDPATATTGDPRGTADWGTEPDGATDKTLTYTIDTSVPLFGVQHYSDFSITAFS